MAKITDRELAFCEEYVANGYKQKAAYLKSFETENENSASVSAHRLLRKVEVIEKIKEIEGNYRIIGMALGVDRKFIMQKLKDMMSATKELDMKPDNTAINNAINTWAKLTGEFEAEKKAITIDDSSELKNPDKMTPEEVAEEKKKILKEL